MGWLFFNKPTGVKAVDAIRQHCGESWWTQHVVASSATREAVFAVCRYKPEQESAIYVPDADGYVRGIAIWMIKSVPRARDGYNFGYKDMSETSGPYGCEAPLSIIAAASELCDPIGPLPQYCSLRYARQYRDRSRAAAGLKATKRKLTTGQTVTLAEPLSFGAYGKESAFKVERQGRKVYFRAAGRGFLCRLAAHHLQLATITNQAGAAR